MDKPTLSERNICTKFIPPALRRAGWDEILQIREEVSFTKSRIIVRGKLVSRGQAKRADYVLYFKPDIPLALIEAKDNAHSVGDGTQQGLEYAATLVPKRSSTSPVISNGLSSKAIVRLSRLVPSHRRTPPFSVSSSLFDQNFGTLARFL
jgi:type I site-specific restriction endonuclease